MSVKLSVGHIPNYRMKKRIQLRLLGAAIGAFGLITVVGGLALDVVTPLLRASSVASGALLVVAAVMLFRERKLALPVLWMSTFVYFLSIIVPSLQRHGTFTFSYLVDAFYWSMAVRIVVAIFAHRLLSVDR